MAKNKNAGRRAIDEVPVADLVPYARNARTHSDQQVAEILASMVEFGFTNPVLADSKGIVAGHGRVLAAARAYAEGMTLRYPDGAPITPGRVPRLDCEGWSDAQRRAYIIADNKIALNAGWDEDLLADELAALRDDGFDLSLTGFSDEELADLLADDVEPVGPEAGGSAEAVPDVESEPVSRTGDIWVLGGHRVMCGDSTSPSDVEKLMGGAVAHMLHADPPYGMGKQADGVANDNLYAEKLDKFQMRWWLAFRPHLADNASAYIWGNSPDLWRLWYRGGLADSERLELRNEIVWDKKAIAGMASPGLTQFPEASERCLFFQFGNQFIGNVNADDFPESWEVVRGYFYDQAASAGIGAADVKKVCGCGMYSHWFTRSQFTLMPEKHYRAMAAAYPGHFTRPWRDLKAEWDRVKGVPTSKVQGARSYFDNAHDVMRDVWEFSRVTGEDRHGHATPKPVAMMERIMRSSLPDGGLCVEPFGGSGSTLVGAEKTGRRCYAMELQGVYVDVIVRRWQDLTGRAARLEGSGMTFAEVAAQRGSRAAAEATARIIGGLMVAGRPFTDSPAANEDRRIGEVA